ncbi:MAG: hypothetical protein RBR77_02420 [Thauera sp.]|jgi:hypothetical protein|nr:hypothetical protein [Thauera sp.]
MNRFLMSVLFWMFWSSLAAHGADCLQPLPALRGEWREHRSSEFILQYALTGEHALQNTDDALASDVPDVVADAAIQLMAMRDMLQYLHFRPPLASPRYRRQGASHILVRFRRLQGINGRAFDEVRRLPSGECVLIIELDSHYRSGNLTPAHEFFHQVQNGYTPFKQPWFYEGTARWAETILGKSRVAAKQLPKNTADLQFFWQQSYAALPVWYALIEHCGVQPAKVKVPGKLRNLRYRNGSLVVKDDEIPGHALIVQVMEALEELGKRVTGRENLMPHHWPERTQREARFAPDMWKAVLSSVSCQPPLIKIRVDTTVRSKNSVRS